MKVRVTAQELTKRGKEEKLLARMNSIAKTAFNCKINVVDEQIQIEGKDASRCADYLGFEFKFIPSSRLTLEDGYEVVAIEKGNFEKYLEDTRNNKRGWVSVLPN